MSFGVRNFTVGGNSTNPILNEFMPSIYSDLSYPALNANSFWIPPYTKLKTFSKGSLVWEYET
jgi:hypothetical protein